MTSIKPIAWGFLTLVLFIVILAILLNNEQSEGDSDAMPLWTLHIVSGREGGPDGVRLKDVNGDGLDDVVTTYESSGDVVIFFHPGFEYLDDPWPFLIVSNVPRGEDAFFVDVNQDGNVDVFSSHEGDTLGLFVHWAPTDRSKYFDPNYWVSERIEVADGHAWMFAIAMDVNEDGRIDIVAGSKDDYYDNRNSVGELAWLELPTDSQDEWRYHPIDQVGWPMSIESIDLDQDGDLDILLSDQNADEEHQGLRWLENPGGAWEQEWDSHFIADLAGIRPNFLGIGDLDDDGISDLVVPDHLNEQIIFISLATPLSPENPGVATVIQHDLSLENQVFKAVGVADVDLDSVPEIVAASSNPEIGIGYFDKVDNAGSGNWIWVPIFDALANPKYDLIAFYDVDRDGDLDFFTTEENGIGVIWLENPAISAEKR